MHYFTSPICGWYDHNWWWPKWLSRTQEFSQSVVWDGRSSTSQNVLGFKITHFIYGLYITQVKYASKLLSWAGLTNSKIVNTLVKFNAHLTPSKGKPLSNLSLYKRLIDSLVYLTVTHPNISYVVHQVSQYLFAPWSTHYDVVLRILRYLKGTLFHGLFYFAQSPLIFLTFSNTDWAGDPTNCKSTTDYCFLLGSSLISWWSKKQTHVARSNTEAEYHALTDTTSELPLATMTSQRLRCVHILCYASLLWQLEYHSYCSQWCLP